MEELAKYIGPALTAVIVPIVLGWLLRSASAEAKKKEGVAWLEYGPALKGLTLFFVAIVAALVVLWFRVEPTEKRPVLFMVVLFGGLTFPMVIEFFLVRIGFDSARIYCHSGWRKKRAIDWSDVTDIEFSQSMQWWVIRTKKRGKIRASIYLSGLHELLDEVQRKIGKNA